jgi:hypothetical protein
MFTPTADANRYDFETSKLKGYFEASGPYSGIRSLVHKDEGSEWVGNFDSGYPGYDIPPGARLYLLSFYHYLGKNLPHLILGRNMPGRAELKDGAVRMGLGPLDVCQTDTNIELQFSGPETLDLTVTLAAQRRIEDLEICLSSYTVGRRWASPFYYLLAQPASEGRGLFAQPQDTPFNRGWYHTAPRDNRTAAMLYDGRWPGEKYQIHIAGPYFKHPILVSRNPTTGFALIQMTEYDVCSRVGSLYASDDLRIHVGFNKQGVAYSDDGLWADYSPTYFYLFGETFEAGQTRTARYRLVLTRLGEEFGPEALKLYEDFTRTP